MTDSPSPELRALAERLFAAGRAEEPGPALGRRLLMLEAPDARASRSGRADDAAPPVSRARRSSRSPWLACVGALAIAAAGAGLWWSLGEAPVIDISPDPVARARTQPLAPAQPSSSSAASASDPAAAPDAVADDAVAARRPSASPAAVAAQGAVPSPASTPLQHAPASSSRSTPSGHSNASVRANGRASVASASAASAASGVATDGAAPAAPALDLAQQLELLKGARAALRGGDAARALELLDHDASAGAGLAAEATLLRIEALAAVGRRPEASELASRFVRDNPNSALGDRAKGFIIRAGRQP